MRLNGQGNRAACHKCWQCAAACQNRDIMSLRVGWRGALPSRQWLCQCCISNDGWVTLQARNDTVLYMQSIDTDKCKLLEKYRVFSCGYKSNKWIKPQYNFLDEKICIFGGIPSVSFASKLDFYHSSKKSAKIYTKTGQARLPQWRRHVIFTNSSLSTKRRHNLGLQSAAESFCGFMHIPCFAQPPNISLVRWL